MSDDRLNQLVAKKQSGEAFTKGESVEAWVRIVGGILAGLLLIVVCGLIIYACASVV